MWTSIWLLTPPKLGQIQTAGLLTVAARAALLAPAARVNAVAASPHLCLAAAETAALEAAAAALTPLLLLPTRKVLQCWQQQ